MKRAPVLVSLGITMLVCSLHAQLPTGTNPGAVQKGAQDTFEYYDLQKKLLELQRENSTDNAKKSINPAFETQTGTHTTFLLTHFDINSSDLLSREELSAVTSKYEGRQVSLSDLAKVVEEVNHLYEIRHYPTAHAILPAQRVVNGVVKITLIESRVGKVSVGRIPHTRDSFVLDSLHLESGEVLRIDRLQSDIFFLNHTSDLTVKAVLQPGAKFGTSDIELQAEEPENQHSMFFFDNAGRDGIGNLRLGLSHRYDSLLGFRDPLTVGMYGAAGTIDYFASYEIPLNHFGTRFGANFDDSQIQILSGTTQAYGIAGHSTSTSLKLSQPLIVHPRVQFTTSISADYITSRLESQNQPLTDALVRSLDFAANVVLLDTHGVWSFSNTATRGNFVQSGTHLFLKYDSSIVRMQKLWRGVTGLLRVNGQTNGFSYLPSVEQFQVGGVATVRGYPEGRQIGDRGYTGTAELQIPSLFRAERFLGLSLSRLKEDVFVDTGAVYDSYRTAGRPPGDNRYLTSVGGGLILSLSKYLSGRLDWGVPVRNTNGIPSVGFHFYLQSSPPLAELVRKLSKASVERLLRANTE